MAVQTASSSALLLVGYGCVESHRHCSFNSVPSLLGIEKKANHRVVC